MSSLRFTPPVGRGGREGPAAYFYDAHTTEIIGFDAIDRPGCCCKSERVEVLENLTKKALDQIHRVDANSPREKRHTAFTGVRMDYRSLITIEPRKRGGRPCLRGMRITVDDILGWLAAGMTNDQIVGEFPELTIEDIRAALAYAADREHRLTGSAA